MMPRWLLFAIFAVLSWGGWAVLFKGVESALDASHAHALSTLGMLPVMMALAFSRKNTGPGSRPCGIAYAFIGGIFSSLGTVAYYHAFKLGGKASTVISLSALYPLLTIMLALILLRERVNRIQIGGIAVSLIAIYLLNGSTIEGVFSGWFFYALLPIFFWGMAGFFQKISTNHISGEASTLWFHGAFIPVAIIIMILQKVPTQLATKTWVLVTGLGLLFSLGNFAILAAFAAGGKASIITPLTALYPVVGIPLVIFFFKVSVGLRESAGIALALLSAVALAWERPAKDAMP
jgi:uncharacterized membrane protein